MTGNHTLFMTPEESERVKKTIQDRLQKCQEQSGKQREPSDPQSLIQQATSASLMQDMQDLSLFGAAAPKRKETMPAYAVGCPYLPCTTKLEDLKPINLSDLRMETHHRGRVLSLRRVSPVVELKLSSWATVQGESLDEVERLEVFLHKEKNGKDVLNLGSEYLVKEPYYTLSMQGEPTIRIDHPSDIVISSYSDDPESWRQRERSDTVQEGKTAVRCKEEGNSALQAKEYARAHASYSEGLKLVSKGEKLAYDLHRNRSHVNLLLHRFDQAISDALSSLTHGEDEEQKGLDAKAYYRAGSAAYALCDFQNAKDYFENQEKLHPDNQNAKIYLRKIKLRLQEKKTGTFDFNKIVGTLSKTKGRPDVASFDGYNELKESPGAGRGLFATRDIEPNEIVMCERAFCVTWSYEPEAFSALACDARDDAEIKVFPAGLHKALVQKLINNPSQIEKVTHLFGDHKGLGSKLHEVDGDPVVDTFQIHDIIQRNAFGPGQQTKEEDISNASTGLWARASYINHSCVSNAKKDFVGDLMIIRAVSRIAAGQEITISYDETSDYDMRTATINRNWGFKCRCALCKAEEADDPAVRKKRLELEKDAGAFIAREKASGAKIIAVTKAKRFRQALDDTYDKERYKGLPCRALLGIEQWLQAAGSRR